MIIPLDQVYFIDVETDEENLKIFRRYNQFHTLDQDVSDSISISDLQIAIFNTTSI